MPTESPESSTEATRCEVDGCEKPAITGPDVNQARCEDHQSPAPTEPPARRGPFGSAGSPRPPDHLGGRRDHGGGRMSSSWMKLGH